MNFIKKYNEAFEFYLSNPFDDLNDKTLIFFDTETTGFSPHYRQITEIAAIAVDGDSFEKIETFQRFIKLSDRTLRQIKWQNENPPDPNDPVAVKKRGKSIEELLKMTDYQKDKAVEHERKTLYDFIEFVEGFNNPILVAHNAQFDMKMVMTKLKKYKRPTQQFKVLDTLKFSKLFLIPAIQSLSEKDDEIAKELLNVLKKTNNNPSFVSSSLGNLNKLVKDNLTDINWHSGLSDVEVTIEVFKFIKDFYEKNKEEVTDPLFKRAYAKAYRKRF
jgi:DNA polymerase III alpha subunit (gram-positive type)